MNSLGRVLILAWAFAAVTVAAGQLGVSAARPGDDFSVKFRLTNQSGDNLLFRSGALPWEHRYNLTIVVYDPKSGNALRGAFPVEDQFRSHTELIRPGQTREGEINLNEYVSGLPELHTTSDLLVFWYYDANKLLHAGAGSYGGVLELPRRRK